MASSSVGSFLMIKKNDSSTYEKLVNIRSYPDLGAEPSMLDADTLSHTFIPQIRGRQQSVSGSYTILYDLDDIEALKEYEGEEHEFSLWFGGTDDDGDGLMEPTGDLGKWDFKGSYTIIVTGADGEAVREATLAFAITELPHLSSSL
ncbi:MAG: phage tail protein [Eubacteriales bacterium]